MTDTDKTLRKGLQILDMLSTSDSPRGAADLARELGLTRSNTFRLLNTLADLGYVRRADETGRFVPTLKSWEIGMRIMARDPLRRIAQPHLRSLHEAVGLNVYLSVLDGMDVLYLDKVESDTLSHVSAQVGTRLPAFLVASGHVMLAHGDIGAEVAQAMTHPRGEGIDPYELARQLQHAAEQGWSRTIAGSRPGVVSLAAPIRDSGSRVIAAVAISGAEKEMAAASEDAILTQILDRAWRISRDMG